MEQDTKLFIEKYIKLIEENQFDDLYALVRTEDIDCSDFTDALYKAGIQPLEYMTYVPNRFAADIKYITEYSIPENITIIKPFAFSENSLHRINFPKSLITLSKGCFEFCKELTLIDTKQVTYIEQDAFLGCSKLDTLVTSANVIDNFAFKDCMELKNIHISKNLNTIGYGVFNHVPATEIHYGGTKDDWSYVVLSHYWREDSLRKIICTDGEILL